MYIHPLEQLIDLLTYQNCTICGVVEGPLCQACFTQLTADAPSRCYKCNKLTRDNRVCSSCSSRLHRVWWVGEHREPLKQLISEIKLNRNRLLARQLGTYADDLVPYMPRETVVCPVPTAAKRIRARGFDQAVLLAKAFSRVRRLTMQSYLERVGNLDQIGKRRSERFAQMKSSFAIRQDSNLRGKTVLLVDDVLTTGATLESAAALLRSAGAKHVDALVITRRLLS